MADQINSPINFSDSGPDSAVNAERLLDHVNEATVLNGAVLEQTEKASPAVNDCVMLGDPLNANTAAPQKATLAKLMPDSIRWGQNQYAADSGSANAYAITLSPAPLAYSAGMSLRFKAANANTTASTLNVNTLGAKAIVTPSGAALASGNIAAGQIVEVVYDGTSFQMTNATSGGTITPSQLSETARNSAYQYVVDSGSANAYTLTLSPAATTYAAGMVIRWKSLHTNTGASTVNVNTLGAKSILKNGGTALAAGDIVVNAMIVCVYDGTNFQMVSPPAAAGAPTYFRSGKFATVNAAAKTVNFTAVPDTNYAVVVMPADFQATSSVALSSQGTSSFVATNTGGASTRNWYFILLPRSEADQ